MITIEYRFAPVRGRAESATAAQSSGIAARVFAALLIFALSCAAPALHAQRAADPAAEPLVGTWLLAALDSGIGDGEPAGIRGARGLLVIDRLGHVFEFFEAPAAAGSGPQPSERQQAFAEYGGFWGRWAVTGSGRLEFDAAAGFSPDVRGLSFSRTFEFDGERLVITSADEPQAQAHKRWTWERVPTVENLTPAYREIVGFWRHVEERRVNVATGEVETVRQRDPSVIVYTPAGYFGVHFPALDRAPFATDTPSADEAQTAFRSYIGYYGALGVYPGEVAHNVLSGTQPSAGAILRRFAEINGDEAVLTIPTGARAPADGPRFVTTVHMRRLSGVDELLPR